MPDISQRLQEMVRKCMRMVRNAAETPPEPLPSILMMRKSAAMVHKFRDDAQILEDGA